ncbi:MAG TPA: cytochrome c [Candidatus Binatia bacterium]|nr:cytochrome c [Candidatus Binatia bacterium]
MKRSTLWLVAGLASICLVMLLISPAVWADDSATVFKSKCAMCHGPDGKGETPTGKAMKVSNLASDEVQKKTDAQLTETTTNGKNKMPAFKGKLTDEQIKDLVKFIRGLAKKS